MEVVLRNFLNFLCKYYVFIICYTIEVCLNVKYFSFHLCEIKIYKQNVIDILQKT